jgi:hypothetical protein
MLTRSQKKTKAVIRNKTYAAEKRKKAASTKTTTHPKWFENLPGLVDSIGYLMPAGTYLIGDLSKTLPSSDWTEVCKLLETDSTEYASELMPKQGRFTLQSGRDVFMVYTGCDGVFTDSDNGHYVVDSGTLGVTLTSGLQLDNGTGQNVFDWSNENAGICIVVGCPNHGSQTPVIAFHNGLIIELESVFGLPSISNMIAWGGFEPPQ